MSKRLSEIAWNLPQVPHKGRGRRTVDVTQCPRLKPSPEGLNLCSSKLTESTRAVLVGYGLTLETIRVKRDGVKTIETWHESFWQLALGVDGGVSGDAHA